MKNQNTKPAKRRVYAAMQVLVEMEVRTDATQAEIDALLRHKMQTFAALNGDIAVSQMKPKGAGQGYELESLP